MIHLVTNYQSNYQEDPVRFLNFDEYGENTKDCLIFVGAHPHDSIFESSFLPKYFFSTEEQTWDLDTTDKYINYVEKIFTICDPKVTNRVKREFSFFPTNKNLLPLSFDKEYDVIYTGYANAPHVDELLNVIKNYKYAYVSFSNTNPLVTHFHVNYKTKFDLISKSKITVVHNLTASYTPQLKSRPFEAAFGKSLILCKRDDWNFLSTWFDEGTEFFYYNNAQELQARINDVLSNYERNIPIIENAYRKAMDNYTTEAFVKKHFGL
jgi:glycosyltransferase involved in cell wall biosynthesis